MSTLQISLAAAGGVVLAAIVAHSAWTSRRNTPKQAERPPAEPAPGDPAAADPLAPRMEPGFDAGAPLPAAGAAVRDPVLGAVAHPDRKPLLDPLIDVIAPLPVESPVSGEAALAAMPPTRRAGSKPFAIEGLNDATGHWELPAAGQRYRAFQAGVQLANRTGALNDIEYSEFVMKTQAFADAVNAAPEFPDMLEEVARARELDQFAGEHDAQLAFMLRARAAAWSPGYVQQNAARLGFVPGAIAGRMVLPASAAGLPPVLTLAFDTHAALADDPAQSAVREVLLSLDVAHVQREERPFARLREAAAALAQAMDGVVCDQQGEPLAADAMDGIGAQLETLYDTLERRDLAAGSLQARRLFS